MWRTNASSWTLVGYGSFAMAGPFRVCVTRQSLPLRSSRLRSGFYAYPPDLRFGAEPVFHVAAVLPAMFLIVPIRAAANFFFEVRVQLSSDVCGGLLDPI